MHPSTRIVLAKPEAPLSPGPKARPLSARHWFGRRRIGLVLSAALHALVVAALTLSVPVFGRPAPEESALPVELVPRVPEPKAEEKKPEEPNKPEEPKKVEEPKKPDLRLPETKPIPEAPQKAEAPPPVPAAKPAPPPPPSTPQPEAAPHAPERPMAAPPRMPPPSPAPPPEASLPPVPPPPPAPATPSAPDAGLKVDADAEEVPPPGDRKAISHWVLEPLVVNLRSKCGLARITGVLELTERIAEGRFRGTMRTRIAWASCAPEGVVYNVELRIRNGEVEMIGNSGFVDRGVIRANMMLLEDAYGRSVWRKR